MNRIKKTQVFYYKNLEDRCIFADEITLNLKAGSQLKERETAHTNNISQRRVFTEENRK